MPTYQFKCNSCEKEFEVFVSISEREKVKCPNCDSSNLSQMLSGFYVIGSEGGKGETCNTSCSIPSCSTCGKTGGKR